MSLCPLTGVWCGRLDCDPSQRECAESRINPVPLADDLLRLRAAKDSFVAYDQRQRDTNQPRCMHDVYLSIERSIDDLADIARQRLRHAAALKVTLETLEQVKGVVQVMRKS